MISIHAPRTGSDRPLPASVYVGTNFNPRSPHGERPSGQRGRVDALKISIHAPRTGSDALCCVGGDATDISIHAPRTGSDPICYTVADFCRISIHAPRTGSDINGFDAKTDSFYFNPRSPHGERRPDTYCTCRRKNFNPRSPHGERHSRVASSWQSSIISIHAPRTGSDFFGFHHIRFAFLFQSTLPARGATQGLHNNCLSHNISIHAPRTGSDPRKSPPMLTPAYFNPRSPHGERHPLGGLSKYEFMISIHAPRTGSDTAHLNM